MAWNEAVVTDSGLSVMAKGILEGKVEITSALGGESRSAAESLKGIKDIPPPNHTLNIAKIETENGKAVVNIRVQNKGVKESFVIRQIGLFAKVQGSDDSPVLMAVIQDEKGEAVPTEKDNPEFLLEFNFVIPIENGENIDISLTPVTFATLEDLGERESRLNGWIGSLSDELTNEKNITDAHISNKNNPHSVTKAQVGLSNVPNVATNDQTPTYIKANTLAGMASGEKISTAFGKISKAVSDLISHLADGVRHITAAERTNWNSKTKTTFSRSLNSGTKIGTVNVDGIATDIYCEKNIDTTYPAATADNDGLMSAADKAKLDRLKNYDDTSLKADITNLQNDKVDKKAETLKRGTDLNSVTVTGFYACVNDWGYINKPGMDSSGGVLQVLAFDAFYREQIFYEWGSNNTYVRSNESNNWLPWAELIASSGGTFTGPITLPYIEIPTSGEQLPALRIGSDTAGYLEFDNNEIRFRNAANTNTSALTFSNDNAVCVNDSESNRIIAGLSFINNTWCLVHDADAGTKSSLGRDMSRWYWDNCYIKTGNFEKLNVKNPPWTIYSEVTTAKAGLMSADDKKKLDGLSNTELNFSSYKYEITESSGLNVFTKFSFVGLQVNGTLINVSVLGSQTLLNKKYYVDSQPLKDYLTTKYGTGTFNIVSGHNTKITMTIQSSTIQFSSNDAVEVSESPSYEYTVI